MWADHRWVEFKQFRAQASIVVLPIQFMVDKPVQFFDWLQTNMIGQQRVLGENARLRARQLLLEAKLQRLLALERENAQLLELLKSPTRVSGKTLIAQLISVSQDPLIQQVILNKGKKEGIFVGQPVLDAYGVMGRVIEVTPYTSRVLLMSDATSAIPVQNNRTGARFILAGDGDAEQLNLLHVSATADIQLGDVLVTSGLGGQIPFGYPVGEVMSIKHVATEPFAIVAIKPSARLNKSRQVIVLWP